MAPVYFHIQIIIFLINLTLGYVVWTYNAKSDLNRILTLIIACILLLDISLLFYLRMEGKKLLYATILPGSLGISFFSPLFFTLSLHYPVRRKIDDKYTILVYGTAFVLSVLMALVFPREYLVNRTFLSSIFVNFSFRKLPLIFILLYFLVTCYSVGLLVLTTRNLLLASKMKIIPYERKTIYLLTTVGIPMALILITVDVINFFFVIPFPWISFLFFAFTAFLVILVFRFHIVDLRRFVNGIIFYPALIAILVFIYIYAVLSNQHRIAEVLMLHPSIALVLEVFVIYLVVMMVRRVFDISVLRRRFPNVPAFRTTDIEPLEHLSYAITLKDLKRRLKEVFRTYFRIEKVSLLVFNDDTNTYTDVEGGKNPVIEGGSGLLRALGKIDRGVTLEELLLHLNGRQEIDLLYDSEVNLVLPIKRRGQIISLVLLPKRSLLGRWSYEDISSLNYLKVIIPPLIDRCRMYENEREIEKHQYRMEQYMVVGQMASGLAHEIRNPLSIISTSVETILKDQIDETERITMLRYIQEEADRINILANKLLNVNYQKSPEVESVNLAAVFTKLRSFLEYKLKDRGIRFTIACAKPCVISSDPNLLFQIFLNLALNSIEAINDGGDIEVSISTEEDSAAVIVRDDGPGIPERDRKRIYDPFFTTKKSGSGLGLSVTKTLVESLYGRITLLRTSTGTSFEVVLPSLKMKE
ncbi:MAG: HAMP domain-containing histidine kinase [Spirochaetes bacterium]|nr:HAMP domain-containing histidine kinase [Spirochaetota bacterium]